MEGSSKKYATGIEATLDVIGGKWKGVIVYHLTTGRKRTLELRRLIPKITQKMLTQQLRELERDGIVIRTMYHQIPPKVEYELSAYGWSLKAILDLVCLWGELHVERLYGDKTVALEDYFLKEENCGTQFPLK